MAAPRVAVIINPISGTGGGPRIARVRAELAARLVEAHGADAEILITEGPGHGRELARAALARGATLAVAWGGDGTVNEVGSALAFGDAALGIVPAGSGNGLARELRVPFDPAAAIGVALSGEERLLDAGELDGRLFFNVAGFGLDARVAHQFAARGLVRRGLWRYVTITARELFRFEPDEHTIVVDGHRLRLRALLIALANARQYGSGALIAPQARLDDGLLDVVAVAYRSPWAALLQVPRLFMGRMAGAPGVIMTRAAVVEILSAGPALYHVDGEPHIGGASLVARVHPRALRVRVPRGAE